MINARGNVVGPVWEGCCRRRRVAAVERAGLLWKVLSVRQRGHDEVYDCIAVGVWIPVAPAGSDICPKDGIAKAKIARTNTNTIFEKRRGCRISASWISLAGLGQYGPTRSSRSITIPKITYLYLR